MNRVIPTRLMLHSLRALDGLALDRFESLVDVFVGMFAIFGFEGRRIVEPAVVWRVCPAGIPRHQVLKVSTRKLVLTRQTQKLLLTFIEAGMTGAVRSRARSCIRSVGSCMDEICSLRTGKSVASRSAISRFLGLAEPPWRLELVVMELESEAASLILASERPPTTKTLPSAQTLAKRLNGETNLLVEVWLRDRPHHWQAVFVSLGWVYTTCRSSPGRG